MDGHYVDRCNKRYDHHGHTFEAQLTEALTSSCSISRILDIRALAHMTPAQSNLDQSTSHMGKNCVIVENGVSLPITHTESPNRKDGGKPVNEMVAYINNSKLLDNFTCKLNSEFATKDLGSLSYFLVFEATSTTDGLLISQLKYAQDIFTRAQLLNSKLVHTPMVVSQHLSTHGPLFSDPMLYRSLIGALQYLAIIHPDIAYAIHYVSQFLHSPTKDHFVAVKRILRYIKGILHFGVTFHPSTAPGALVAYSNAYWTGCSDTHWSTFGYFIYLGNNLVSWSAKKQPVVSHSSCESEYRALAPTTAKILWLTHVLHDLKFPIPQQPLLLCDNKSAIFLSYNPVSHKQSKHVELDYHFLGELVLGSKLCTQYVPSHLQVVDIFTKVCQDLSLHSSDPNFMYVQIRHSACGGC
ncbi:uncharacterized mitochondrial protein AtMg00810-like [Malania oleifera]|uniref:uncharacterized mitochondrial protein AtMg00810-like n=1 Tax=Malania oleifera TaxID=397392 RepID=UPI0025AEC5A7|nr:uncharacterized mitochondrial protein AtMg00810-like [Malania oleifera]